MRLEVISMTKSYINIDGIIHDLSNINKPDNRNFRDAWVLNENIIEYDKNVMVNIVSSHISEKRNQIISSGVRWRETASEIFNDVRLSKNMSNFLDRTQEAINHSTTPRPNIHGGILFQDGRQFNINDAGIVELSIFAYSWGLKISQIANNQMAALSSMTCNQLEVFDCDSIDWTVTWDQADIDNGWSDNTLTQTP